MGNWIRCIELEQNVHRDHSPVLHINLDNVRFMIGCSDGTILHFGPEKVHPEEDDAIKVHETPEEILSGILRY
jgi:hypothetical protein